MEEKNKSKSLELQKRFFGRRHCGATLASIGFNEGVPEKIVEWMKNPKCFLVLCGPPGTGKTYFCAAMMDALYDKFRNIRYYEEGKIFSLVRQGMNEYTQGDYRTHLSYLIDDDLIFIDDIGSTGHTDWREEVLFSAIDFRYLSKNPTVITTNLTRKEMTEQYGARIASRLYASENLIIDLYGYNDLRKEGK